MRILTTKAFWADACERAIKTLIQAVTAALVVGSTGVSFPGRTALLAAGVAAVASILTSIGSALGQTNSVSPASIVPPGL